MAREDSIFSKYLKDEVDPAEGQEEWDNSEELFQRELSGKLYGETLTPR